MCHESVVEPFHQGNPFRADIHTRVGFVQARHVAQDDQQVGFDQHRDLGGQRIVVAELNLIDRDRIVFVDDRHDLRIDQRQQGVFGIEVAPAVRQIVVGQQHLRDVDGVARKTGFVQGHERNLADCRGGLFAGNRTGTPVHVQPAHARGHRAGRDHHELHAPG